MMARCVLWAENGEGIRAKTPLSMHDVEQRFQWLTCGSGTP
jgi:hypothetical protein